MTEFDVHRGGVYVAKDPELFLETRSRKRGTKRLEHGTRTVIILSNNAVNSSSDWAVVLAVPTTSKSSYATEYCVHIPLDEDNGGLSLESWAVTPVLQPVKKSDIIDSLGTISPDNLGFIEAKVLEYIGMQYESDEEELTPQKISQKVDALATDHKSKVIIEDDLEFLDGHITVGPPISVVMIPKPSDIFGGVKRPAPVPTSGKNALHTASIEVA